MTQKMLVTLTAVILSGAAVTEAQVNRFQPATRRPEPVQRPVVHERPVVHDQPVVHERPVTHEQPVVRERPASHLEHQTAERRVEREPESRPERRVEPEYRSRPSVNRQTTIVYRPVNTPAMRHAMTYNTRPGGVHIHPQYFATHYGRDHGFHINGGFRLFGAEYYFNWNGGWFGVIGTVPGNWALQSDYLYIDVGDDGNYYLYNAQYPDLAVQLTFVQNVGDDQADTDQDQ